jgi:hypothetical protein
METTEKPDRKELYKALQKFSELSKPIVKDSSNPFFKSKYATLDAIQEAIKPWLTKCGLILIQGMDETSRVRSEIIHVESGQSAYCYFPLKTVKEDAQGYGSAMSYAKRYSISGLLNLTIGGEDDDGNKASYSGNPDVKHLPKLTEEAYAKALERLKAGEDILKKVTDAFDVSESQLKELKKAQQAIVHTV